MPTWEQFLCPVLRVLDDGHSRTRREVYAQVADLVCLSAEQRAERLNSSQLKFENRIGWALSDLSKAEAVLRPRRGVYVIAEAGRRLLSRRPDGISKKILLEIDAYRDYVPAARAVPGQPTDMAGESALDPVEQIEHSVAQINADVAGEVLKRLREQEPVFLEKAVLTVLLAMGYGGTDGQARHIGGTGDGGVDGVIDQDKLGLQRIYVQAKRYAADNTVGREAIQAFVGALHGRNVSNGIFITTSRFSPGAIEYANSIGTRIVLIDGARLAELMITYSVGVQVRDTYRVVELDEDYFE